MIAPKARPTDHKTKWVWLPILLLLIAMAIRAPLPWLTTPLDVDEALYASFGRAISHENNPFLKGFSVDKPPLAFWVTALSFKVFGTPSEWAARLPSIFASIISIAAAWKLSLTLYRKRQVALFASLIMALSQLDAAYAGTVFTDPLVTMWVLLASVSIVKGHWHRGGIFAGLAFITKQSALQFLPLILGFGMLLHYKNWHRNILRFAGPYFVVGTIPFWWMLARQAPVNWWALGSANNSPDRLIRASEVLPRFKLWGGFIGEVFGSAQLLLIITAAGLVIVGIGTLQKWKSAHSTLDVFIATYLLGYISVYWLLAFNTYIRYAHPLIPLLAILAARIFASLRQYASQFLPLPVSTMLVTGILVSLLFPNAIQVREGQPALTDGQLRYQGIQEAAVYLNSRPPGTIVYDRWLGWELGWYLGQSRPTDMWLRVTYYPTPESLVTGVRTQDDQQPRYLVIPEWVNGTPWLVSLNSAGYSPFAVFHEGQMTVFRLDPP